MEIPSAVDPIHTGPKSSFPPSANADEYPHNVPGTALGTGLRAVTETDKHPRPHRLGHSSLALVM